MLDTKTIKDPQSAENIFCKAFDKAPFNVQMGKTEMRVFSIALQFEKKLLDKDPFSNVPEKELPFTVQLVRKSLKGRFTFEMSDSLQVFIGMIGKSAGTCIMYLTYLQYKAKKLGVKEITATIFAKDIFPTGFPSEENLQKLWDSQKVKSEKSGGSDNLLDYQSALVSIQYLDNGK